jgi:2-polyprenyl-3-methyl-5-hydroxy-6-metoxy-1,4-benzoquinol methylase
MTKPQQAETLEFFRSHAEQWKNGVRTGDEQIVNVSRQRNEYVLEVARKTGARTALDVGCGSGELVLAFARTGVQGFGIDFAPEMISLAQEAAERDGLQQGARFKCMSIFDYRDDGRRFDLISANGFIEYISHEQLQQFLGLASRFLNEGGSLVVGSRNRLFNAASLNRFTVEELRQGSLPAVIEESLVWTQAKDLSEALEARPLAIAPAQFVQPHTGIDVKVRHQFTPLQLAALFRDHGFVVRGLAAIHIHGVTVSFKERHCDIHAMISNFLQRAAGEELSLLPISSSFMIHGVHQ